MRRAGGRENSSAADGSARLQGFFSFKAQGQRAEVKETRGRHLAGKREGGKGGNRKGGSHIY